MFNSNLSQARAAIYCRVSSEDQAERGTIEAQIEAAKSYCQIHNIQNFNFFKDDGVTGTIPLEERPEGQRLLLYAAKKQIDIVIVYKIDRLGRKTKVILDAVQNLEQLGVKTCSITEPFDTSTAIGSFMLNFFAGLAELDRSNILERLQLGTERNAKLGKWLGGIVPYGYFVNSNGFLEIQNTPALPNNMSEVDVVKIIYRLTVEEHWSTIKIADYLNALDIPTSYTINNRSKPTGKRLNGTSGKWLPSRIRNMIVSTTYKGLHEYGKRSKNNRELIKREVPSIVSEDIWQKAQKVLKENQIEATRNAKHEYLLKGIIKCGCKDCGLTYSGVTYDEKTYYKCNGKQAYRGNTSAKCSSTNINGENLENLIWKACLNFISNPGETILKELENLQIKENPLVQSSFETEIIALKQALKNKEKEKTNLINLHLKEIITEIQLKNHLDQIKDEECAINKQLAEFVSQKKVLHIHPKSTNNKNDLLLILQEAIKRPLDQTIKKKIIKELVKNVTPDESGNIHIHFLFNNTHVISIAKAS